MAEIEVKVFRSKLEINRAINKVTARGKLSSATGRRQRAALHGFRLSGTNSPVLAFFGNFFGNFPYFKRAIYGNFSGTKITFPGIGIFGKY